jgi:ribose transport system substrate-binding protein
LAIVEIERGTGMMDLRELIASGRLDRRTLLRIAAATGGAATAARLASASRVMAQEEPTLVTSIRSLSNPYHAVWAKGGDAFAESVGLTNEVQTTEGDSQKGIAAINAALASSGPNTVINVDPNSSPDAVPIVEAVEEAGAWVVTHWNKPDDLHPRDFKHYVAHISYDGVDAGYNTANELFKMIGGKGQIVAVQGILDNIPAQQRFKGLEMALAENSGIKLLEEQTANWDQTAAQNLMDTWLTKYGDDITAVWCANDGMGLGALEALRAKEKAGTVPVSGVDGTAEACTAVLNGEFAATMANNPFWQGGMGLSIGYHAWNGSIDPSTEPPEHREFYAKATLVTKENAQEVLDTIAVGNLTYDWNDLWGLVDKGIEAAATPTS